MERNLRLPFETLQKLTASPCVKIDIGSPRAAIISSYLDNLKSPMIKHIVMWQLKDEAEGADKATNAKKMKALLDACANVVPGVLKFEVAIAEPGYECTYDVVLYSEFESMAALDAYQNHPQHIALKPFVGAVRSARQCMDYEA